MKTIVFFLLLTGFSGIAAAQTVFAPIGAKWYYSFPSPDTVDRYVLLESEKDTLIQGYIAKKIKWTDYRLYTGQNSSPYYDTTSGPSLYVYVSGDTVFYYHEFFEQFAPLYFFNVAAGDTIAYRLPTDCYGPTPGLDTLLFYELVDSTEIVYIDNVPLQRVWTKHAPELENTMMGIMGAYMERAGALDYYMLNHLCSPYIPETEFPFLRCYTDSSISYKADSRPCDDLRVSIQNFPTLRNAIEVYPNPARETLHILFPSGDATIKLTDISGRIVDIQVIKNDVRAVFDVQRHTSGLYLYQVITDQGIHSGRIMINP